MNFKHTTLAVIATLFCGNVLYSANTQWIWTGNQNTSDWTDKGNWSTTDNDNFIDIADTVVINNGATIYPQLLADASVNTFIMNGGWMFPAGNTLTVDNNIYMYGGEFNAYMSGVVADNVYMYGGGLGVSAGFNISDDVVIDGGFFIPFSSGVVINDDLFFISGTLDMNNQDITVTDEFTIEDNNVINDGAMIVDRMVVDLVGIDTLLQNIHVGTSVEFISGILKTSSTAMLIFDNNAVSIGASSSSYVSGPVRRLINATVNSDFTFPVGNDFVFAPIAISNFAQARTGDYFTAQYFMNRAPYNHSSMDLTLNHVSDAEYWMLDRGATAGTPTTDLKVTLFFDETNRSGNVDIASELRVTKWNGLTWKNLGGSNFSGNNTLGSLKSDSLITSFSPFTIGSNTGGNVLPVSLLDFHATALDKHVEVSWATTSEINNDFFTVQKSIDGKSWSVIGIVDGVENSDKLTNYGFTDRAPVIGIQYYRLIQTDLNGNSTFSHVASVNFNIGLSKTVNVFPNPVVNIATITVEGTYENAVIIIFNSMGKKVMELNNQSGNRFEINTSGLEEDIFTVEIHHENGVNFTKIVKQF